MFWIPNLIALTRCPAMSFYLGNRENNVQTSSEVGKAAYTAYHYTHTVSWNAYIPLCPAIGISQIKQTVATSTKSWACGLKWSRWHAVLDRIAVPTGCTWRWANELYQFQVLKQCRPSHPWDFKNSACGLGTNLNHGGKRPPCSREWKHVCAIYVQVQ